MIYILSHSTPESYYIQGADSVLTTWVFESTKVSTTVQRHISPFVIQRARNHPEIHTGRSWAWDSFRISTMVILSNLQAEGFATRKQSESLLDLPATFPKKFDPNVEGEPYYGNMDGCYLHYDSNCLEVHRAGHTPAGFVIRNKQHLAKSKLSSADNCLKPFYSSYPHSTVANKPSDYDGNWEDLVQVVDFAFDYGILERLDKQR